MDYSADRYWSKVDRSRTDDCWPWTASKISSGYGRYRLGGRLVLAHRVAWELTHGPIPAGEGYHGTCVCHRCDNRVCCNPSHLFLATHLENVRDMRRKNRGTVGLATKCTTHSDDDVRAALQVYAQTGSLDLAATHIGATKRAVINWVKGKTRRYIR